MAALSELEFEEISKLLQQYFRVPLEARLQHAEDILKAVALQLEKWVNTSVNEARDRLRLREELLTIASSQLPKGDNTSEGTQEFSHYFGQLQTKLDAFIGQQEELRHEIQKEERFLIQPDDATLVRTTKRLKDKYRRLEDLQHFAANWLRNALGSEEKQRQDWSHAVPWQGLLRQHLQINMLHRLQELLNISERQQAVLLYAALELSRLPDRQPAPTRTEVLHEIDQQLKSASHIRQQTSDLLQRQLQAILGRFYIELEEDYPKAGTLELPAARLKAPAVQKKKQQRQQQIEAQLEAWKNTRLALGNQWLMQLYLQNLIDQQYLHFDHAQQQWQERLQTQVFVSLDQLAGSLHEVKETLQHAALPQAFADSRLQLQQQIAKQAVPAATTALYQQDLPGQLQSLEGPVQQILASLPEHITLGQPLKGREPVPIMPQGLTPVHARELVSLEVLPMVAGKLVQLREEAEKQIEEIRLQLNELEEISLFNLDVAQTYLDEHPQDEQKARIIALEGLDRVLAQLSAIQDRLRHFTSLTWQELQQLQARLSKSLLPLNSLEHVKSLQIRLMKGKPRRSREQLPQSIRRKLQAMLLQLQQYLQETLTRTGSNTRLQPLERQPTPAATLSDLLAKHEQTMLRLPFVYQRLYSLEPLTDELFLVGRNQELHTLQKGYRSWVEGTSASILICSEKGSGATSLLNAFIKRLPAQQQICRIALSGYLQDEQELATALALAIGLPPESNLTTVQQYLLRPESSLVLVVEDLQLLFRRWVGGFDVLKSLLELISLTSRPVFWLCSCSLYSWQYLRRAIHTADTWSMVVPLEELSQEQLSELILRRQRVSGYQLQFVPGPEEFGSKRFTSQSADEQQAVLEQKFFQKLTAFSQGNPHLALLYWLSATVSVSKENLVISTSLNPDLRFLQILSPASYFYLHALLLHDQLTSQELAHVLGESVTAARRQLQVLSENGLLQSHQNRYRIHPLLYKQLVHVLKQKNLLN